MKKISLLGLLVLTLMSCNQSVKVRKPIKCVVDSVEYHGVGQDHVMQLDPYWKLYVKEYNVVVKSRKCHNIGDTIEIDSIFIK